MKWQPLAKCSLACMLLLLQALCSFAQDKDVSGQVMNQDNGEPLEGVTVSVKGSNKSIFTNAKGVFTLKAVPAAATLKFSYIGFEDKELAVGDQTTFSVSLSKSNIQLEDVVVIGYGTQRKAHLTGAIVSVNVKDIEDIPVGSLAATLQGRMPGVAVSGGTTRPGNDASIVIRNPFILSKDGGTLSPLYVIDDVIRTEEDFNLLDASEVESISILKDASAAIYGARSSQGVVIIRTKRGKAGKPQLSYNSSIAFNDATQLPKMMTGDQLATYMNDLNIANGKPLTDPLIYTPDEIEYFKNNNYDWLGHAWKSSYVTRHAFNVSGGTDKATFFAGASYFYQNGNLDRINTDKWTFRASADVKLAQGLKAGLSVSGDLANKDMYLLKQGGENAENDMKGLLYTPGYSTPYVNGLPVKLSNASNQNTIDAFHFFEVQRLNNYNRSRNTGLNVMANLEYQIPFVPGLSAKVQYSKLLDNGFPKQYGTKYKVYSFSMLGDHKHIYGGDVISTTVIQNGTPRIYLKPSYSDQYQFDAYLNYSRKFGKHDVSAVVVVEQSESYYDDVQAVTDEPTEGAPDNQRFAFGTEDIFETSRETGSLAYIGRVDYGYDNKYLLQFQFRYDASTNFAPEYRWGFFPSVSAGWVISQEGFFNRNVRFVDFLKLRASAGHLGGDATKAYGYLQRYSPLQNGGAVFGGNNTRNVGTKLENMPNYAGRWDDDLKFNAGLDAAFLKSRLTTTVEAFYDHRYNMLTSLTASVPLLVGSVIASENYSTINGYGLEVSVGWKDQVSKNVNYYVNTFLSWSDAKSVKVDIEKGKIGTYEDPNGHSTDMGIQGYYYEGMFRTQADVDAFLAKNPGYTILGKAPLPGMLYYKDIRGAKNPATNEYAAPDGKIDENDQDWIVPKASNHYGFGISTGISWKGLRLDVVMSGSFGGQSSLEGAARKQATITSSRPSFWADHWTPENPNAQFPAPLYSAQYDVASSFWFKSSFNFRMRNLALSYALSPSFATRIGFNGFKVYVNVANPVNFYNPYSYKDNANGSYDAYPNMRTAAIGINASF
jgi:TonB-linked SusC/RagA family outer membrane protein